MTGASHWLSVGNLEIGTYIDTDGRVMLAVRGETHVPLDQASRVIGAIKAVVTCGTYAPAVHSDHPQRPLL